MPAYLQFKCKCGRTLRVKVEQSGSTVRCWSCQAEHTVPRAQTGGRLARLWTSSLLRVLSAEVIFLTLFASALMAISMAIPRAGTVLSLGLLAGGGFLCWPG